MLVRDIKVELRSQAGSGSIQCAAAVTTPAASPVFVVIDKNRSLVSILWKPQPLLALSFLWLLPDSKLTLSGGGWQGLPFSV